MKTQTRVLTSVAASLAVSALITCIVYFVIRDMNRELARDLYFEDIMDKTYALSLMTARFRGDPDPGLIRQIREVQRSLEKSLGAMSYLDAREESLVRRINTSSGELGYSLEKLISSHLKSGDGLETERDSLLVSQLWMKTQFISDDTRRLMEINKSRIAAAQAQTGISILALIVALTLINGAISFFSGRSIVRIQDDLESQRKWFQVTLASIGDAVIATDKDSRIAFLNPVAAALTRWPIKEALGRSVKEVFRIINEKTREPAGDIVGLVMRDGGKVALANHTALVARNGHEIPIEDSAAPIKDGTGQVTGVVLVFHDVTEKRRAQEALRESEARFREVFENMSSGVAVYEAVKAGQDFIFKDFNRAAERIEQIARLDLIGKSVIQVFPSVIEFGLFEVFQRVWQTGTAEHHPISLYKDRRIAGWRENYVYKLPSGEIVAIYDDITERKKAEEALKASLAEKEVLLKEIHHRVKNNMQVISSLVALQADQLQDEAMRAILQDVTHRVRSMALVHEKLYQSTDLARVDFAEYARSLLNYLWRAHGSAASGIRLSLDLDPVSLSVDTAVPCGLILNELASNALKHAFRGSAGGEVAVSLRGAMDGEVRLCVRDNGKGFPEGFDWKQANTLGLRLVQMLAGQLHAAVEVSTLVGTGFSITFELAKT